MRSLRLARPRSTLLAVSVAALAAAGGCSRRAATTEDCTPPDPVVLAAAEEGQAPAFALPDVSCHTVRLDESKGRVRLIDFWATWCPPCREEIPMLNALHQEFKDQGLTILAISDERSGVVREFAAQAGMNYTNLVDTGAVGEAYGVVGLPTAFLVDQDGRIVDTYVGPKSRQRLEQQIRELLARPPAG